MPSLSERIAVIESKLESIEASRREERAFWARAIEEIKGVIKDHEGRMRSAEVTIIKVVAIATGILGTINIILASLKYLPY